MGNLKAENFEAYSNELFPDDRELARLCAMSNIAQHILDMYYEFMVICDRLEDKNSKELYLEIAEAMITVHRSTMYNKITLFYIDEGNKYMNKKKIYDS